MPKSLYEEIDNINEKEVQSLSDDVDRDNPEITPNCRVRIVEHNIIGKVLWITESGVPVVLVGDAKMQIKKEGLIKLK